MTNTATLNTSNKNTSNCSKLKYILRTKQDRQTGRDRATERHRERQTQRDRDRHRETHSERRYRDTETERMVVIVALSQMCVSTVINTVSGSRGQQPLSPPAPPPPPHSPHTHLVFLPQIHSLPPSLPLPPRPGGAVLTGPWGARYCELPVKADNHEEAILTQSSCVNFGWVGCIIFREVTWSTVHPLPPPPVLS